MNPFHSTGTFLGVQYPGYLAADPAYAIIGVPWDHGVTNRPGARLGPRAIREASMMLTTEEHPTLKIKISDHIVDSGDHEINPDPVGAMSNLASLAAWCLGTKKIPIVLGGDHTITQGLLMGTAAAYPSINVIHFDAHNDTWGPLMNRSIHHGAWLRNAIKTSTVKPTGNFQFGIRSNSDLDASNFLSPNGNVIKSARDLLKMDATIYAEEIARAIETSDRKYWFTFDIDCLDPAFAPGTGTPEVGGLTTIWVLEFIETLVQRVGQKIIGMDMVEVCPAYDHAQITALAAATITHTFIAAHLKNSLEKD